jgi:tRNA-specific 2-thiouridylase
VDKTVTVGPAEALDVTRLTATESTYTGPAVDCFAQVRAHGAAVPAVAEGEGGSLTVTLRTPVRGMAPGQAVVLYSREMAGDAGQDAGSHVLGGGRVVSAA